MELDHIDFELLKDALFSEMYKELDATDFKELFKHGFAFGSAVFGDKKQQKIMILPCILKTGLLFKTYWMKRKLFTQTVITATITLDVFMENVAVLSLIFSNFIQKSGLKNT